MRAMILAAGLGTRMQPLSSLRAKPALPVRGRPVIAYLLELLARHGFDEVIINLHHLPDTIVSAVEEYGPREVEVSWSHEERPLGTGGGIARARAFLEQSDPFLVLAGDMLLDADLSAIAAAHCDADHVCTLLLRRDPRAKDFGTIGVDDAGRIRRIGRRLDLGDETDAGVFVGVRVLSPRIFESMPNRPRDAEFEDLRDWLAPALGAGDEAIRARIVEPAELVWEPVGTPAEYLAANLAPPTLSYVARDLSPTGTVEEGTNTPGPSADVILGVGAEVGVGARLSRCVVWDGERVPEHLEASGGVFAGGRFYACEGPDGGGEVAGTGGSEA